jgi:predicted NAD/FAD-dependent oxidoreductase
VIIGAGLTGLTAAHGLTRNGLAVTVLDKGRGVGGRLASRSFDGGRFDHGAQYFSVKTTDFEAFLNPLKQDGLVREWNVRPDGHPRYAVGGGMSSLAKALAANLDVRTGEKAVRLQPEPTGGCVVFTESGQRFWAETLLLTLPVPQALALFEASEITLSEADRAALTAIDYDPCWAVMATLRTPPRLPDPGGLALETGPVAWLADNQRKGLSQKPAVTIHASAAFSRENLDNDPETVKQLLLAAAREYVPADTVLTAQIHRWRYSLAAKRHPEPFLKLDLPFPAYLGGDAFGRGNVEGAFWSGKAMGEAGLSLKFGV